MQQHMLRAPREKRCCSLTPIPQVGNFSLPSPECTLDTPGLLVIGTRGSPLALAQTAMVRAAIAQVRPSTSLETRRISTRGDRVQDRPLAEIGGKALFVEEIEAELRAGRIHLAVHSGKDIPSVLPHDMCIAAYLPRADPRDALVSRHSGGIDSLPPGARVGTSSPRRACQLRALRSDLEILDIRGNVETRLAKLDAGTFDAIVLAVAGLTRLGLEQRITHRIPTDVMIPCAAQGAIAIEVLAADQRLVELITACGDVNTMKAVSAERAFLAEMGGSCDTPLGAHATVEGHEIVLRAVVGNANGAAIRGELRGSASAPLSLGTALASQLLEAGGAALLAGR